MILPADRLNDPVRILNSAAQAQLGEFLIALINPLTCFNSGDLHTTNRQIVMPDTK